VVVERTMSARKARFVAGTMNPAPSGAAREITYAVGTVRAVVARQTTQYAVAMVVVAARLGMSVAPIFQAQSHYSRKLKAAARRERTAVVGMKPNKVMFAAMALVSPTTDASRCGV
jgi:hypothetical protein